MTMMLKSLLTTLLVLSVSGCAQFSGQGKSLYEQIGGQETVVAVTDNFIRQIEFDRVIFPYFAESNVDRFREKFIEHFCLHTDGPCEYSGDDMIAVHKGMNITESHFNRTVDLLINAMSDAGIPHRLQNRILARLAPLRKDMIYR